MGRNGGEADSRIMQSTSLAGELGIKEDFAPDRMAPPVDRDLIREFVGGSLTGDAREQVLDFLASFRPWRDALQDVLREGPGGASLTPPKHPE